MGFQGRAKAAERGKRETDDYGWAGRQITVPSRCLHKHRQRTSQRNSIGFFGIGEQAMRSWHAEKAHEGFVVVVVLCVIIMLGVLLFGFNRQSRVDLNTAERLRSAYQALNCARAGLSVAIAAVKAGPIFSKNKEIAGLLSGDRVLDIDGGSRHPGIEGASLEIDDLQTN